jgi:hypothetical protein
MAIKGRAEGTESGRVEHTQESLVALAGSLEAYDVVDGYYTVHLDSSTYPHPIALRYGKALAGRVSRLLCSDVVVQGRLLGDPDGGD